MRLLSLNFALAFLPLAASAQSDIPPPLVDHHQHLFAPTVVSGSGFEPVEARDLVALLDKAGIGKAVILSIAYQFSNPNKPPVENEYERVKAENDWTSAQVGEFPDRLRGFCSVNPLKDYAIPEIERCAKDSRLHYGLKLHFGNSDVQLENKDHVKKVREVFRVADGHRMAIVVHMRSSVTKKRPYGAEQAMIFLHEILPAAPHVPVQIAHLAGSGGYDDPAVDEALQPFVEAIARHDKHVRHLWFDVSGIVGYGEWAGKAGRIADRIRQLGVNRILYGSDGATGGNLPPREAWEAFRKLPLSGEEFRAIAMNVAPYMKSQ